MAKILILTCWDDDFDLETVRGTPETAYLLYYLRKYGIEYTVCFPSKNRSFPGDFVPVKVKLLPSRRIIRFVTLPLNYFLLNFAILRKTRSLNEKYNLVYSLCSSTSFAAWKISKELGIPYVQKFSGLIFYGKYGKFERWLQDFHTAFTLKLRPDLTFVVDDGSGGGRLLIDSGLPKESVVTLPNPVPEKIFPKKRNSSPVVGWVGRFNRLKGVNFLPDIAAGVLEMMPDVKFRIVGFGPYRSFLEKKLSKFRQNVTIEKGGTYFETLKIYGEIDLFISTNIYANYTLPVLEALAHGTPVVAFDVPGTRRLIVDGKNGYIVPTFDTGLFSKRVVDALVRLDEMVEPAREAVNGLPRWLNRMNLEITMLKRLMD